MLSSVAGDGDDDSTNTTSLRLPSLETTAAVLDPPGVDRLLEKSIVPLLDTLYERKGINLAIPTILYSSVYNLKLVQSFVAVVPLLKYIIGLNFVCLAIEHNIVTHNAALSLLTKESVL